MMLPFMVGMSFLVLGIILLLGKLIRVITPNLQKLFIPSSLIGGIILELFLDKFDKYKTLDRNLMMRIQGLSLDVLIVSAIATLSLDAIGDNLTPFIILSVVMLFWIGIGLLYFGRK